MDRYEPLKIEEKWQKIWEDTEAFKTTEQPGVPKMMLAEMFPYPSAIGLHVGHVRNFTIVDVLARFYRQQGLNVLRPFGYDTFGLPAENFAIKNHVHPRAVTERLGYAIDWSREINTSDPEYYRWTQWCFLQLFKKSLAYQKESYQWWCPVDQTVLANEQVENGHCWRCGHEVEKKKMKQWFFKITEYADELLDNIDSLNWPDKIKTMQKNWIGRSVGAEIDFKIIHNGDLSATKTTQNEKLMSHSRGSGAWQGEDERAHPVATGVSDAPREKTVIIRNLTIKKVTEDIYKANFNTAVAALMEYVNELYKVGATQEDLVALAKLLKPFAPHLASEMLERLAADDEWPKWDDKYLTLDTAEIIVQVNGKLRAKLSVATDDLEDENKITSLALADEKVKKYTESGVKKTIFVKKAKLLNIVV